MSNLDVALRLRLEMWKPGQVKNAANDLARLAAAGTKLNSSTIQSKLGNDLRAVGAASGKLVAPLNRAKLGADQLGKSFDRVRAAGMKVTVNPRLQAELKGAGASMNALAAAGGKLRPVIANADELARALERVRAAGWRASKATEKIKPVPPGPIPPGPKPPGPKPGDRKRKDAERLSGRRVGTEALAYAGGGAALLSQGRNVVAGAAVAGGVLAVGGAFAKATGQAMSFEKAMAEVQKKVDLPNGQSWSDIEKLITRNAIAMGKPRAEMAGLTAELGAAGIAYSELGRYMQMSSRAAVAWDMPLAETTEKLMKMKAGNQYTADQLEDEIDKINALSDAGASKERDVVNMQGRAAAAAKTSNVSTDTTMAYVTAMNSVGVEPEIAARGWTQMVKKLRNAKSTGSAGMEKGLKALGITPAEMENGMKADADKMMRTFIERFSKAADKSAIGSQIFGNEWDDEFARLAQAITEIDKYTKLLSDRKLWKGSALKTANIELSTTTKHFERMQEQISDIGDRLGRWTLPPIKDGIVAILDLFKQMDERAEALERLQAAAKKVAAGTPLSPEEASAIPNTPEGKKAIAAAVDAQKRGAQADDASITGTKIDQSNGEQSLQQHAQLARRNLQREADALEKRLSLIDPEKKRNLDQARLTGMRRRLAMYQDAPPGRAQLGPARFGLTGANPTGDTDLPKKGVAANIPPAWATGGGESQWQPRPFALGGPGGAGRPVDDADIAKVQKLAAEIQKLQGLNIHLVSDEAKAANIRQIEDLKTKLTTTLTQADLSAPAREMMQKYASTLGEQGAEATKKAQAIIDQIKALLNVTLTPTIAPRLTMPSMGGATPASAGGGTPVKKSAGRTGGPAPIQIGQAHFHGVSDVAGMQRQLASAANRRARDSADNSLKDMDTGSA